MLADSSLSTYSHKLLSFSLKVVSQKGNIVCVQFLIFTQVGSLWVHGRGSEKFITRSSPTNVSGGGTRD